MVIEPVELTPVGGPATAWVSASFVALNTNCRRTDTFLLSALQMAQCCAQQAGRQLAPLRTFRYFNYQATREALA